VATFQILQTNVQWEVFQYRLQNVNAAKQRRNNEMLLNNAPIKWMIYNLWPEIKTFDDMAECYAMPQEELQNHNAGSFEIFANFTEYIVHNRCFSHLINAKYIWYNMVAIPVTSY